MITVFTPTYNRANLLSKLYESLCRQTNSDFEWLIVDDGSTDHTESIVKFWLQETRFNIRYLKKNNGGKHTAINFGVLKAKGELFLILDSDDSLPDDAIDNVTIEYKKVKNHKSLAGVCGLMAHHDGTQIGSGFPADGMILSPIEMRFNFHVTGDLLEVWKTDVLKEFPFPEINGEKFCPEALVWNRIGQKYKLYCFNRIVYYRDYLDGGLTDNIIRIRMMSPISSSMCYAEQLGLPIPFIQKIKSAINYCRFRLCGSKNKMPLIPYYWLWLFPLGYIMHINDKRNWRNDKRFQDIKTVY